MLKFKMTCPNCGAVVVTPSPESLVWELCPGCRRHVWDGCDAMMADIFISERQTSPVQNHADN